MTTELKPCPFCGGQPRIDLNKVRGCSLHGDPMQSVRVYCYRATCLAHPSVSAGDTYNGGEQQAREQAIAAWNARAPSPAVQELAIENGALRDALEAGPSTNPAEVDRLRAENERLREALEEAREFIDGQIDVVDGSYGIPEPNKAMLLAREIDAALSRAALAQEGE